MRSIPNLDWYLFFSIAGVACVAVGVVSLANAELALALGRLTAAVLAILGIIFLICFVTIFVNEGIRRR